MDRSVLEDDAPSIDLQDLIDRCLGNLSLVERIVAKFEATSDRDLADLETAILNQDSHAAALVAHRIKGASANISAQRLRQRAENIEKLARQGSFCQIEKAVEELRDERSRFAEAFAFVASNLAETCSDNRMAEDRSPGIPDADIA